MTVKEAVNVLKRAKKIVLGYGANAVPFDKDDALMMDAYGSYLVDEIRADDGAYYEINICMRPVRGGEA
jgi:hypothetical protein